MTLDIRSEAEKLVASIVVPITGVAETPYEKGMVRTWLPAIESLCRKVREEGRNEGLDEAASVLEKREFRKHECSSCGLLDDERESVWKHQDFCDLVKKEILSLKSRNERSSK